MSCNLVDAATIRVLTPGRTSRYDRLKPADAHPVRGGHTFSTLNRLTLKFNPPALDFQAVSPRVMICVDDKVLGETLPSALDLLSDSPASEPMSILLNDRGCLEECCPGLWATVHRSENSVTWSDFRSAAPDPDDPPRDTRYEFSIEEYRSEIESAKARTQGIQDLDKSPDFSDLCTLLHAMIATADLPDNIQWLMSDDLIRKGPLNYIRCRSSNDDSAEARNYYETLRRDGSRMRITIAIHPCSQRTLLVLEGCNTPLGPAVSIQFCRRHPYGKPVHSTIAWTYLRCRFGINRSQPGYLDINLPHRLTKRT